MSLAAAVHAQARPGAAEPRMAPRWELPGLDISPNGGWRVRARAVAATRARLLAQRNFSALNAAPAGGAAPTALTGELNVPVIMFRYQNSPAAQYARDTAQYDATLFATSPPGGKPYTLRTFYEQMSNTLFSIHGAAVGWVALANNENSYTGAPGTCSTNPFGTNNCNGLFGNGFALMQAGLREALTHADSSIDFGQFDNDGPDGIPNSGDDDGVVDAVLFLHPSMDGACLTGTNNHLWSHRSGLTATGSVFTTNDNRAGGGKIIVNDYMLQSGLGSPGATGSPCDSTAIMPIGTAAHELGHILALPDLYDVSGPTEGIGEYGLMGSGNYTTGNSPAHYDAWSLQQMGWTTVRPLTTTGTYTSGPVQTADTVFVVNVPGSNLRNEYFLLENRQKVQSDSAMLRFHCNISGSPPGCGGGLIIYHVDGLKACMIDACPGNQVNSGPIHGLAVEEADGLRNLWNDVNGDNRGDGGDPYPGTSGNSAFSFKTTPAAITNIDSSFAGFAVDSIRQLVPDGEMSFRLRFGGLTLVQASDTAAQVQVDAAPYTVFRDLFDNGSTHTIAIVDSQLAAGGRTRFTFQSWSDGGAISHQVTGTLAGTNYVANLGKAHRLDVVVGASGTVGYSPAADSSGVFIAQGTPVTLTATPTGQAVFGGWTGDTTASSAVLILPMGRPFALSAHFDPALVITTGNPRPGAIMGASYADTLRATGGGSSLSWQIVSGSLPAGLALGVTGRITGIPTQTGPFTFTARVTSGAQQQQQQYSITVTAPTLAAGTVLTELLNGAGALTTDQLRYLDLLGNNSCGVVVTPSCFDLGDFLAWVQATGATPTPPLAVLKKGGRQ
jgi:M6 family metalloprotease-like protein